MRDALQAIVLSSVRGAAAACRCGARNAWAEIQTCTYWQKMGMADRLQ